MRWFRRRLNREIAPEDIFLDSENLAELDHTRFEGRIERPLSNGTFIGLVSVVGVVALLLTARAWQLQIVEGRDLALRSESNSLAVVTLFAPRGVITDRNGIVLAENTLREDGSMIRRYPYPEFSHLIGYVTYPKKDSQGIYYTTAQTGVAGLEAEYDAVLSGDNGRLLTETDVFGNIRSQGSVVPPREGLPLRLTLDTEVQRALERAVSETAHARGFIAGAGVLLDISTGEILALTSYPSYDGNVMSEAQNTEKIEAYFNNKGHPFVEHAVQGVYAPGSVVKPLVAAGALTDGVITAATVIDDQGSISIDDPYNPGKKYVYTGWRALGPMDVKGAIAWSSDIFFYTVGGGFKGRKGLGIDRLAFWYQSFGLGTSTNLEFSGEANGLVPTPAWKKATFNEPWYVGDTYFTAIGQYAMQVTPLQMARAIGAVANNGRLYTPTLVMGKTPRFTSVPVTPDALSLVQSGMRLTVTEALATALNVPYVKIAAKTGTAQTGTRNQYDNSWVVGYFPYDAPKYSFAVVLERGPQGGGSQAVNATAQFLETLHAQNSPYVGGTGATSTTPLAQ